MIDWVTGKFWITHNPDVLRSGQSIRTKIVDGVDLSCVTEVYSI